MYSTSISLAEIQARPAELFFRASHHSTTRCAAARLLIVEEHELIAAGLQLALSQRRWQVETDNASSADAVIDHVAHFEPQCVLLDAQVRSGGVNLIEPLADSGASVVVLTAERRRTVLAEYLEAGAVGWIRVDTSLDEVDKMLNRAAMGDSLIGRTERSQLLDHLRAERARSMRAQETFEQLTQREALVLAALTDGLSADEIARAHFVALTTVRSQIRSVLQKLGVRSQLAAVALADAHRELLPYESSSARDRRRSKPVARECAPAIRTA